MHVGIVGCGIAGAAAAIFLRRAGHQVTVLERAEAMRPVGAGLLIQPTGMAVLERLGLLNDLNALGARVDRLHGITRGGRTVLDLAYRDLAPALFGLGLHRGALFDALWRGVQAAGAEFVGGFAATRSNPTARGRLVFDAAGRAAGPFDLLVVADGARSALRGESPHCRRAREYPWGALWFVGDDAHNAYDGVLAQVYHGTRQMIGFLPTGHAAAGGPRQVSLFWSVRCDALPVLRAQGLEAWKKTVRRLTPRADPLLDQITDIDQLIFAAYYDAVMWPWHSLGEGPVVYIGDAAHAMSPQLGQGANLGLLDAATLSDCLAKFPNLPQALALYSRTRRANINFYHLASRWLTPVFQSGLTPLTWPRDLLMGPVCRLPYTRRMMLDSLAGSRTSLWPWSKTRAPSIGALPTRTEPATEAV